METTTKTAATTATISINETEESLLLDALHEYRDRLAATIERFEIVGSDTLPPAPGSMLAALMQADSLLHRLDSHTCECDA